MLVKKEKKLKDYEMMVTLKPLLPDDLRKDLHKEFVDMVEKDGGEVLDVDVWGKRYLSYEIEGHNEGYYIIYDFRNFPDKMAEMRRQLELKQEILRFMIVEIEDASTIGRSIKKKELKI
jgi:small subunit ribosomal protein S6